MAAKPPQKTAKAKAKRPRAAALKRPKKGRPKKPIDITKWAISHPRLGAEYRTERGVAVVGKSEEFLAGRAGQALKGRVQLVFTSPPFPLNRKKQYGNLDGPEFKKWLKSFAKTLRGLLTPDGSIVIEMGNAWEPGLPVMSTLAIETLLAFKEAAKLHLIQEFIWFNPARLPTPAQWVTIERIRVKDAFTRLWWLSPEPFPKADNRRVLAPYSDSMKSLLKRQKYNAGPRPSEHVINPTSFLKNNEGAIPPNVLTVGEDDDTDINNLLVGANTTANDAYQKFCKTRGFETHPARMPIGLAKFFINLCTEPGDLVFDPFGGSNTTGAAAEELDRKWVSVEANQSYAQGGRGRFPDLAAQVPAIVTDITQATATVPDSASVAGASYAKVASG